MKCCATCIHRENGLGQYPCSKCKKSMFMKTLESMKTDKNMYEPDEIQLRHYNNIKRGIYTEMELKQTVELMNSEDFKKRFVAEYYQVQIRATKLAKMLKYYKEGTLTFKPECSYDLLHQQLIYMYGYLDTLEKRADIEGINLSDTSKD